MFFLYECSMLNRSILPLRFLIKLFNSANTDATKTDVGIYFDFELPRRYFNISYFHSSTWAYKYG